MPRTMNCKSHKDSADIRRLEEPQLGTQTVVTTGVISRPQFKQSGPTQKKHSGIGALQTHCSSPQEEAAKGHQQQIKQKIRFLPSSGARAACGMQRLSHHHNPSWREWKPYGAVQRHHWKCHTMTPLAVSLHSNRSTMLLSGNPHTPTISSKYVNIGATISTTNVREEKTGRPFSQDRTANSEGQPSPGRIH